MVWSKLNILEHVGEGGKAGAKAQGGVCLYGEEGGQAPVWSPPEQTDRHNSKRYLPTTSVGGGNEETTL